jgi:hypothetical protein
MGSFPAALSFVLSRCVFSLEKYGRGRFSKGIPGVLSCGSNGFRGIKCMTW